MLTIIRIAMLACLLTGAPAKTVIAQSTIAGDGVEFGQRTLLGAIQPPFINEASGLAASRLYPGMYWVHNDNGRHPGLFLIDATGRLQATVQLAGARFQDWEDLAAVTIDDRHYLVVADCGDNSFRRESCRLFVLSEPELEIDQEAAVEVTIGEFDTFSFRFPEGARDCESMAVDGTGTVFLLTKKHAPEHPPAAWYTLTLSPENREEVQTANRLESEFAEPLVTGMDFSPNGRFCVVRSYVTAWLFRRHQTQTWEQVFSEQDPHTRTLLPIQWQGEAICFALDNSGIVITSEGRQSAIWKIDLTSSDHR